MQKILPHLWFDTQAKEAATFYTTLFAHSKIEHSTIITGTPSGDSEIVTFSLAGLECMAISAGPYFKLNPAISFTVQCGSDAEIESLWQALSPNGTILMPFQSYPWAKKYGWVQDKFGLSWQLSLAEKSDSSLKIIPHLLFTQQVAGQAKAAITYYTSIFPDSHIEMIVPYEPGDNDQVGFTKYSTFTLAGQTFAAMDSSLSHHFTFNEAFSLLVKCDTQEEIDRYWAKLSAVPAAEQCGWLKDKFGVSWQIVPTAMDHMLATGTPQQIQRVTAAFLKMKKFDIAVLEQAFKE